MDLEYGVILEGTADMASFCYCYKSQESVVIKALWPTTELNFLHM